MVRPHRIVQLPALSPGLSLEARLAEGKARRSKVSRESHARWKPAARRRDPIATLIESSRGRVAQLLPIRYGRMMQSPFAFFRGAASVMAGDLDRTPTSGMYVQLCGDCHLVNFGGFATPERRMIFDLNDFDETLSGPWEWDLKRLVTSFVIASRHNRFSKSEARECALACARSYRRRLAEFSRMRALDVWYLGMDSERFLSTIPDAASRRQVKANVAKVQSRNAAEFESPSLVENLHGTLRIRDEPPLIYHLPAAEQKVFDEELTSSFRRYRASISEDRRVLLDRYQVVDIAAKVVGVGSVGTRCGILLMVAGKRDVLILQIKEARESVLEPYLGRSHFEHHGQRVVVGQRLMQSASDIFLGWTTGREGHHFYIRQLRDAKAKPAVEVFRPRRMASYAKACGWVLARSHASSGDAGRISGYLGKSSAMDEALADFAERYADQNERDHQALLAAIRENRIEANLER